ALIAKGEYNRALHYLQPATVGWETKAYMCSALTGEGIGDIWNVVNEFREKTIQTGRFAARRKAQSLDWMHSMTQDYLRSMFFNHPQIAHLLP
ncbi:methylmalonyl Co-A mutase-associated GTPase MeaB, partial [Bacillus sp. SIMBA_074]